MARYSRRRARRTRSMRKRSRKTRRTRGPRRIRSAKSVNIHHYKRKVAFWWTPNQVAGLNGLSSDTFQMNPQNVSSAIVGTGMEVPATYSGQCHAWGMNFSLSRTNGYADFTSLYDQYRINGVKLKITFSSSDYTGSSTQWNIPTFRWYRDRDDSSNPTTLGALNEFLQKPFVQSRQLANAKPVKIYVGKPCVSTVVANSNGTTINALDRRGWIDVADADVAHFGIKCLLTDMPTSPATGYCPTLRVEATYYMSFRGVR